MRAKLLFILFFLCLSSVADEYSELDASGHNALHRAILDGNEAQVSALLDAGSDVNSLTGNFLSPLMLASRTGNLAVLTLLLLAGANYRSVDNEGRTAGDLALLSGHSDIYEMLRLERFLDPEEVGAGGSMQHETEVQIFAADRVYQWSPGDEAAETARPLLVLGGSSVDEAEEASVPTLELRSLFSPVAVLGAGNSY